MTGHEPDDHELTERLQRMAAGVPVPTGDPGEDLARGRRRKRRRHAVAALGGVAAVAVIGLSVAAIDLPGGSADRTDTTGFAASGAPGTAAGEAGGQTPTPLPEDAEEPPQAWLNGGQPSAMTDLPDAGFPSGGAEDSTLPKTLVPPPDSGAACASATEGQGPFDRALGTYRDIVADHLDPAGTHLQKRVSNEQGAGGPSGCSIGTRLGWTEAGQEGEAVVRVEVANSWRSSALGHEVDGWAVVPTSEPGVRTLRTATDEGTTAVAVTREDGTVVSLLAAPLFDNHSDVALDGFGIDVDRLTETASDPRFQLP
ncbi:hypothetical protein [Nocardioides insulae]|uniref:hypothetical protein n=1 Tax=Nocardioides insulae TaxID=394734 RepID=UPI0003FEE33F|nr:hypothetical protein [Nocardioides insulae]